MKSTEPGADDVSVGLSYYSLAQTYLVS